MSRRAEKLGGFVEVDGDFLVISLPENSNQVKLLARIRDESHRFAISYHTSLRLRRQTASLLDEIPGIGPVTRKKLIRHFGSARAVINAPVEDLSKVLGPKRGQQTAKLLASLK